MKPIKLEDACTTREMPRYRSHKIVHALKLASIELYPDTGDGAVYPDEEGYAPFEVSADWMTRFKGGPIGDAGYYVVYDGGYASWSPTKAFEDGYARIDRLPPTNGAKVVEWNFDQDYCPTDDDVEGYNSSQELENKRAATEDRQETVETNSKSWIAWKRRAEALEVELALAKAVSP